MFKNAAQASARLARISRCYATQADSLKVELNADLKALLKDDVLRNLEAKTDYQLIKKLNFLGPVAVSRLNTISSIQLQALNSQTCFKIVCFDLEDPWIYYWTKVRKNGNDPAKWLESMREIEHIPSLMEFCFQQMMLNNVYPTHDHFMMCVKAAGDMGDPVACHEVFDDYNRCSTGIKGKARPEAFIHLLRAWVKVKEFPGAWAVMQAIQRKKIAVPAELQAQYDVLEAAYNPEEQLAFSSGRTAAKPKHTTVHEEAFTANMNEQGANFFQNLQPIKEKILSPEQLRNAEAKQTAKQE